MAAEASSLRVSVRPRAEKYSASTALLVDVTLVNESTEPLKVLRWSIPTDGLYSDMFDVHLGKRTIPYEGILAKRREPGPEDFTVVFPQQAIHATVDLTAGYPITERGNYGISFRSVVVTSPWQDVHSLFTTLEATELESDSASLVLSEDRPRKPLEKESLFSSACSPDQQAEVADALRAAATLAQQATTAIQSAGATNDTRCKTWFGIYEKARLATARQSLEHILAAIKASPAQITFECGGASCTDDLYAYVDMRQPDTIYVCRRFWEATLVGVDSKAGTIVHEVSHLAEVAGTKDIAWGQELCKMLALAQPNRAIRNADNYEYFAEYGATQGVAETDGTSDAAGALTYELDTPAAASNQSTIRFILRNSGTTTARVLKWGTPLEGLKGDLFKITRDGKNVPYRGIQIKREKPTADDYVNLSPRSSTAVDVDLANGYDFHTPGIYTVSFRGNVVMSTVNNPPKDGSTFAGPQPEQIVGNELRLLVK